MQGEDMKDREFDAFFRKASEGLEVPYRSDAWGKMQKKLDRPGWAAYLRGGLWGVGTLLLVSALWWSAVTWLPMDGASEKIPAKENEHRRFQSPVFWEHSLEEEPDEPMEFPMLPSAAAGGIQDFQPTDIKSPAVSPLTQRKDNQEPVRHYLTIKPAYIPPLSSLGISSKDWLLPEAGSQVLPLNDLPIQPESAEKVRHEFQRWGISLGLSPDLSGVGFRHIEDISSKGALQLEYFMGPGFSLNSGVIFTRMIYQAAPEDYRREMSYRPDWVNAQCRVLEIPLNLRWYALREGQHKIYLSGGLSSYFMLSEDYEYVYKSEDRGIYTRNWGVKNENHHLYKVASLSVGYERSLGKRWAIQAEPFVRLPLAGVGAGQVKLSTAGMFFSANYRWGRRD
jgi:hypothetical protein